MNREIILILCIVLTIACKRKIDSKSENTKITVDTEELTGLKDMVLLKGGKFESVIDMDTHNVVIEPFMIDKFEVSIAEFEKFVDSSEYIPASDKPDSECIVFNKRGFEAKGGVNWKCDEFGNPRDTSDYNYPVIYVSHIDAENYAKWAGKRLPTIFEWLYTAKSGVDDKTLFKYIKEHAWHEYTTKTIRPCGLQKANFNGVYDIFGNVGEHVEITDISQIPAKYNDTSLVRTAHGSFFDDPEMLHYMAFTIGDGYNLSCRVGFICAKDVK